MQGTQLYIPPLSRINKIIVIALVAAFVLDAILTRMGLPLAYYLGLSADLFLSGHIYQIVTYPLASTGLMGLVFECLLIWFLGSDIEHRLGEKNYIQFLIICLIGAGCIYLLGSLLFLSSLGSLPLMGPAGVGYALCVAYALFYSERPLTFMLIFPMKAKWFCMILAAILLYTGIFSSTGKTAWAHFSSMVIGFAYIMMKYRAAVSIEFLSKMKFKKKKNKVHLYVVEDEDDDRPTYH